MVKSQPARIAAITILTRANVFSASISAAFISRSTTGLVIRFIPSSPVRGGADPLEQADAIRLRGHPAPDRQASDQWVGRDVSRCQSDWEQSAGAGRSVGKPGQARSLERATLLGN